MEGQPQHHEQQPTPAEPRIYAASLADYNDGHLHGRWIDANQPAGDIHTEISDMLSESKLPDAEEWAIHDYEGFASFKLSEYENIDTVARLAAGISEHGAAFAHWVDHVGTSDTQALDDFDDHYLGAYDSLSDYAESLLEDLGQHPNQLGPEWLRPYIRIDYQQLGQDLASDLYVSDDGNRTHLFQP